MLCKYMRMPTLLLKGSAAFSKNKGEEHEGVKFDEAKIQEKIEQMRIEKLNTQAKRTLQLDIMPSGNAYKPSKELIRFRQSVNAEHLFAFENVTLTEKPTLLSITGYCDQALEVDGFSYPPALILFKKQILVWQAARTEELTIEHFALIKHITPEPSYVLFGTQHLQKVPQGVAEYLRTCHHHTDSLQMFQAISQFNTVAGDDINLIAFLICK